MNFIIHARIDLSIMYFIYKHALSEGIKRGRETVDDMIVESFNQGTNLMRSVIINFIKSVDESNSKPLTDAISEMDIKICKNDLENRRNKN